ncbi:MAG: HAMP domain-containing histidine kinase, partial [Hymenobacteraceae bacterium]|nr:HAMP domain-containing histidine kinase [Hymenobacteraceae bacterium]MDX5397558.1 HAMP domain-containing histidine kinase [Hymenobacteraceae bacterium]MDX5443407.1 HAMP domain-containing histidine kinase [Hymenobacteraceae bacterium]MDX5513636.1 HAMP domain-containing histidine kinase [Hymenobacteraceae bacterium]
LDKDFNSAYNMLNNLLLWAGTQMAGANVQLQPINVQQIADENLFLLASNAQEKNIEVQVDIPENTLVLADKERLNFVLRNLMLNAVKFTGTGGKVLIKAENQEEQITITVQDTGVGMSEKEIDHLNNGKRFSNMGTANEKGSGLGLMLCTDFVKSIGGTLTFNSEKGKGSSFVLTLPIVPEPEVISV